MASLVLPCGQVQAQSTLRLPTTQPPTEPDGEGAAPYQTPQVDSEGVLREMADRAVVIFVGTVTAVRRATVEDPRRNAASSIVEVDFAVEHAVKEAAEGSVYTLREWAGLWRDSPRFAVGQRLLMLLHAAGPGGLSSPVDGMDGAIPVRTDDASSPLTGTPSTLGGNAANDTTQNAAGPGDSLDMSWLQAKTLRTQTFADEPAASPGESSPAAVLGDAPLLGVSGVAQAAAPQRATVTRLTHVLGLLQSWRENRNVSR